MPRTLLGDKELDLCDVPVPPIGPAMRLRRSDLGKPGYGRRGSGRGFRYVDTHGDPLHDHKAGARIFVKELREDLLAG